jgi:hypothetical protein
MREDDLGLGTRASQQIVDDFGADPAGVGTRTWGGLAAMSTGAELCHPNFGIRMQNGRLASAAW